MKRAFLMAAALLLLAAPAYAQRRTPVPDPGSPAQQRPDLIIREIRVEGNKKAEADAIRARIKSKVGEKVDQVRVALDIKDVYALGLFRDVVVEAQASGTGVALVYKVVEKPSIWSITFEGNDKVTQKDLEGVVDIKPFSILDKGAIAKSVEKIRGLYAEKGFFLAEVSYRLKEIKGNRVILVYRIDENRKVQVRQIEFIGNKWAKDSDLRGAMQTREGDAFSWITSAGTYREDVFAGDVELLQSYYLDHGFIHAQIEPPRVALSRDKRWITITINVVEGDQYWVGSVDLKGDLPGDGKLPLPADGIQPDAREKMEEQQAQVASLLRVKKEEVFSRSLIGQDIVRLTDRYGDDGYAYANIYPLTDVNEEKKTIAITYDVQKGQKVYVERINIKGNTITRDKVVRRELLLVEGDLYNGSKVKRSKENITRLGYFEDVTFSTPRGSRDDTLVMNVEVKEKPTGIFSVGAGFSSSENFVFTAQVQKNNFLGYGYSVAAAANVSSLQQRFDLQFLDPFFLDTDWTAGVDLYNRQQVYRTYTRIDRGADMSFGHYLDERREAHLSATYRLQDSKIANVNVALLPLFGRPGITSSVIGTISWDQRDNRLFPTRGFLVSASSEYAGGPLQGDLDFLRFTYNARGFVPVGPDAFQPILRGNFTFGQIFSTTGAPIPIFEKFTAGGINSVRGYALNSLGPTIRTLGNGDPEAADQQFPTGGNELAVMNLEVEFPIIKPAQIRGVLFYDMGNAFRADAGFGFGGVNPIRKDYGFGVRWFSPIGPLRFEWGFPIAKRQDEAPRQFQFTIGSFF